MTDQTDVLEKVRRADADYACMAYVPDALSESKNGPLRGVFVGVKDNLCVDGMPAQAGSRILEGYVPPFTATAVSRLQLEGATVVGKTVMDAFGFGTFNVNTYKIPKNPHDVSRAAGGSSGGSAVLTAATGLPCVSESTGGSISAPAAFCGVVGVTPTYGKISRYGLIDYANSLDKIGSMALTVREAFGLIDAMAGPDAKDMTSLVPAPKKSVQKKAAVVTELLEKAEPGVRQACMAAVEKLQESGVAVEHVRLEHTENALYAYYIIAMAEASTNLAKYVGLRYGQQLAPEEFETYTDYFTRVRGTFGPEEKRRILLGSFARTAGYRGKYYDKAARVRTLVIREMKSLLQRYDVLLMPSMPCVAPRFSDIEKLSPLEHYAMDVCTVPANLAGLPHASVPIGKSDGMPTGLQIVADHFQEDIVKHYGQVVEAQRK